MTEFIGDDVIIERSQRTGYMFVVSVLDEAGNEITRSKEFINRKQADEFLRRVRPNVH